MALSFRPIRDLDFGFTDAIDYQSASHAERFKRIYFSDPTTIEKIKGDPVYFVIGDKGTGKTALATYFLNSNDPDVRAISVFIKKEDFSRFYAFSDKTVRLDKTDFGEVWKAYFLLLTCFDLASHAKREGAALPESCERFYQSLMKISFSAFDLSIYSAHQILFAQPKVAAKEFLNADYTSEDQFSFYVRAIQRYFQEIFITMPKGGQKTILFIDGLDTRPTEGYGDHETHIANVTALINAMYQLNHEDLSSSEGDRFRIIVLVRPDIFEKLELQNVNTIWRTHAVQIIYPVSLKYYRESPLFDLADSLLYTQQYGYPMNGYGVGTCWDTYLPDKFERRSSRAGEHPQADDSFAAILRNTFNRPRDIIYFLNYWKSTALRNNDANAPYFDPKYIIDYRFGFRNLFNEYLLGEIRDSLAFYTDVSNYIAFIQFFRFLEPHLPVVEHESKRKPGNRFRLKITEFDSDAFYVAHTNFLDFIKENPKMDMPVMFEKPERFIQLLYELGLVFFKVEGSFIGKDGNAKPFWKTYADAKANGDFRPQVRLDGDYRLHRGLSRAIYKDVT